MRKHLANVEKEWGAGAMAGVKDELQALGKMIREIEVVIKNQLYYNLRAPEKEVKNGEKNNTEGRNITTS
jgi:hypothetical protein